MRSTESIKIREEYYPNGNLRWKESEVKRTNQTIEKSRFSGWKKIKTGFDLLKTFPTIKKILLVIALFINQS